MSALLLPSADQLVEIETTTTVNENEGIIESDGTGSQELPIISLSLEQCSICSTHYDLPHQCYPQPDLNRIICKLLDIQPNLLPNGQSYFSQYIPMCTECTKKLRKYDKLRVELNILRHQVVVSVVDTLVHIRPSDNTALHSIKNQVISRWTTKNISTGDKIVSSSPIPLILSHSVRTKPVLIQNTIIPDTVKKKQPNQKHKASGVMVNLPTDAVSIPKSSDVEIRYTGTNSWVTDEVSIVAETESEAQEIYAAYVSGNIIQANIQEIESNEQGTTFELTDVFPEPSIQVTLSTCENREEEDIKPPVVLSKRSGSKKSKKGSIKKVTFKRLPQHEKPPYFCEKCGRVYSKLTTLRIHIKICDEPRIENEVICPICLNKFSIWLDLKFHFDDMHPDSILDKCRYCKKDFLPSTIEGHACVRNLEVNPMMKAHNCDHCEKVYYKYTSLTEHMRRNHPDKEKLNCSICHKLFVSKIVLENHAKIHNLVPKGKITHSCSECGINTTTAWGLREHMKLHTNTRPYSCELCGRTFRLQSIKRNHMVVHTKEKNFACEICDKKYTLYATMYRHWKRCRIPSTPRKGRWCPLCGSDGILFQKLASLKVHMVKQHPGTDDQFEICKQDGNREFGFEAEDEDGSRWKRPRKTKEIRTLPNTKNDSIEQDEMEEDDDALESLESKPDQQLPLFEPEQDSKSEPEVEKKSNTGRILRVSLRKRIHSKKHSETRKTRDDGVAEDNDEVVTKTSIARAKSLSRIQKKRSN